MTMAISISCMLSFILIKCLHVVLIKHFAHNRSLTMAMSTILLLNGTVASTLVILTMLIK
ncbi:hypothetical protein BD408DRAFT_416681 [Parasitella parasitica]|nr:hypothetical protein BD408DRAFT_416681 [Parasitella parasitica]